MATCLAILAHGEYIPKDRCDAYNCNFRVPENIMLVKYSLPGKILFEESLVDIPVYNNNCYTRYKKKTRYFIHENGKISKTTIHPRKVKPGTLIQNMFLTFDNSVRSHQMGVYLIDAETETSTFEPTTSNQFFRKTVTLEHVLQKISEKLPKDKPTKVHQLTCHSGIEFPTRDIELDIDSISNALETADLDDIPYLDDFKGYSNIVFSSISKNISEEYLKNYKLVSKEKGTLAVLGNCDSLTRFKSWEVAGRIKGSEKIGCGINALTFLGVFTRYQAETLVEQIRPWGTSFSEMMNYVLLANSRKYNYIERRIPFITDEDYVSFLNEIEENLRMYHQPATIVKLNRNDDVFSRRKSCQTYSPGHTIVFTLDSSGKLVTIELQIPKWLPRDDEKIIKTWKANCYISASLMYVTSRRNAVLNFKEIEELPRYYDGVLQNPYIPVIQVSKRSKPKKIYKARNRSLKKHK